LYEVTGYDRFRFVGYANPNWILFSIIHKTENGHEYDWKEQAKENRLSVS